MPPQSTKKRHRPIVDAQRLPDSSIGKANRRPSSGSLRRRSARRFGERLRILELSHQAVELGQLHIAWLRLLRIASAPARRHRGRGLLMLAFGSSVRISKIEIIGSTQTNRNISVHEQPDRAEEGRAIPDVG